MKDLFDLILLSSFAKNRKAVDRGISTTSYFDELFRIDISMFEWVGVTECDPIWISKYLFLTGAVGAKRDSDKILIAPDPSRVGELDQYGDGTDMIGVLVNGWPDISGKIGVDCVIGYNNSDRSPDLDLIYYPKVLANIDSSLDVQIDLSKAAPIYGVGDEMTKRTLQEVIRKIRDGEPQVILDDQILQKLSKTQSGPGIYSVHLTDPDIIRNAQYLTELWDVMLRRFCNFRGVDTRKTTKHAQVSTAEATGMDAVSWILPMDMLRARERFCEDANRVLGTNWSVKFAEPWASQYKAYQAQLMSNGEEEQVNGSSDSAGDNRPADGTSGEPGDPEE